jgi:hypothetical protein
MQTVALAAAVVLKSDEGVDGKKRRRMEDTYSWHSSV